MSKTLLYRLFRIGRLPRDERRRLESEGLRLIDEGIPITVSWRRYREPGTYIARRHQSTSGAVVLTERRLALYICRRPVLDVALDAPHAGRLALTRPVENTLSIRIEAEDFKPGCTGTVSYLLLTAGAEALARAWAQHAARADAA
jgi:hypothetical protein